MQLCTKTMNAISCLVGGCHALLDSFISSCYFNCMTKLLEDAIEAARHLSADAQDSIARVVLRLAGNDDETPVPLSPGERAAIATSKAAAARGEFATDEQVRAVWAKHHL